MRWVRVVLGTSGIAVFAGLVGCAIGGSNLSLTQPSSLPTAVLFVSRPPSSLAVNATANIYAAAIYSSAVAANTRNTLVNYSISCGSAGACGTLEPSSEGGAIVFKAPSAIPAGGTVTLTATAQADASKSASATITIVPPIPISVSLYGSVPASVQVGTSLRFTALIQNDVTANPQVKWTLSCGGTACGSLSTATTTNVQPTTFTAPAAIPQGGTVTVTATSLTDATKSASATVAITPPAPTLADGAYVFQLEESTGFITGAFVAKAGLITGGEQDATVEDAYDNAYNEQQLITGGNYVATPSGNLQVNLQVGPYETETFSGVVAAGGKGLISAINGLNGTGTLDPQSSVTAPSGGYAVSLYGGNYYGNPAWVYGVVNVDSPGSISGNGSTLDVVGGVLAAGSTVGLSASTVSAPDIYGRVLFTLNPAANSQLPPLNLAGYIVDGARIRLNQAMPQSMVYAYDSVTGGTALGQGANTGRFSAQTVAGSSYVFAAQGSDTHGTLQLAGVLNFNPGSTVSGTLNWNNLTDRTPQPPLNFTGAYAVDSTGRVTLTNLTDGATFTYSMRLYLDGNGGGLLLSNNPDSIFAGQVYRRQTAVFSSASLQGSYGFNGSLYTYSSQYGSQWGNVTGPLTATANASSNDVAGYADANGASADFAVNGSFAAAPDGVLPGTLTGFGGAAPTTGNPFTLYLVDSTQAVAIETDNAQLVLGQLERTQ